MNDKWKTYSQAVTTGARSAPRAVIVDVVADEDGRPGVNLPVVEVHQGETVIWSVVSAGQGPFQVVFDSAPLDGGPDGDAYRRVEREADARDRRDPGQAGRQGLDGVVLQSEPRQVVRMQVDSALRPGWYRYGLLAGERAEELGMELPAIVHVVSGPRVGDGDEPVN